jgi:hypothetical protein
MVFLQSLAAIITKKTEVFPVVGYFVVALAPNTPLASLGLLAENPVGCSKRILYNKVKPIALLDGGWRLLCQRCSYCIYRFLYLIHGCSPLRFLGFGTCFTNQIWRNPFDVPQRRIAVLFGKLKTKVIIPILEVLFFPAVSAEICTHSFSRLSPREQ